MRSELRYRSISRSLTVAVAFALAWLWGHGPSVPTAEQPRTRTIDASAMSTAWQLFEEASELLASGQRGAALERFERAYELSSDPRLLYEVGELQRSQGQHAQAVDAYTAFLRSEHVPVGRVTAARRALAAVSIHTAELQLETNVQGATVAPDRGVARGYGYVVQVVLDAGERQISLSKPGYETRTLTLALEPGESRRMRVDLEKADRGSSEHGGARVRLAELTDARPRATAP